MLEDFQKANLKENGMVVSEQPKAKWKPPREEIAKINFDAAVFEDIGATKTGVVIKDFKAKVLALLSKNKQVLVDPFVANCISLREALNFALEMGIKEVEVEGDSLLLVCAVKSQQKNHPATGAIVEAIKNIILSFNKFRLQPIKRTRNTNKQLDQVV
ncbi:hypothetical protein REPUB_Repub09cG0049900 [Reevesia pubescens]